MDLPRLALALVRTSVPEHLEGDVADVALFGARAFCGNVQQVYRQMSLLLHPDKRPPGSNDVADFNEAFLLLGGLYERVTAMTVAARTRAKAVPWRFPAEQALLQAVRRARRLPPPPTAEQPPSEPERQPQAPDPSMQFMEHINLEAPRLAQNLLAMRSLRIGGDAGRCWAEVVEEYLSKVSDRQNIGGISIRSFPTAYRETKHSVEMKLDGRLQSGLYDPELRSVFGLPGLLTSLFRIGLPLANLDQKGAHFVSIMNLVKELGLRPDAYPDCNAVAYDKAAWLGHIAGHEFFGGKDKDRVKTTLLSIAYQCRRDEAWPQPMKDLHDQIRPRTLQAVS